MKFVYDMSTGNLLEAPRQQREQTQMDTPETQYRPELRLQEINTEQNEVSRIPADLVLADPNAFLIEMS